MVFLLDGSAAAASSFFSDVGGAPNENPGMDAPPLSFLTDAGAAVPNENPPVLLAAALTGSSFFSSPPDALAPKENPAEDEALVVDAGAEAAPAPKLKPTDGAAPESSSSRPRLGLAGVFAGVAVAAPPNENPPAPTLPPLLDDGAAADPPNENPPAPILPAPSSPLSSPRFALAGVAPALLAFSPSFLGVSQAAHWAFSLEFLHAHVGHFHSPGLRLNMSPHPPALGGAVVVPPGLVGANDLAAGERAGEADDPPKENPPAPIATFVLAALALAFIFELPLFPPPLGLGVSHAKQLLASFGFFVEQVSHFHSPGLDLKVLPHPEPAGAAGVDAAGAVLVLGDFAVGVGALASPNLNAMGVSTFAEAAAPPDMKLYGAPPGVVAASAFFIKPGVPIPKVTFFG
mmetsp:Transcript_17206/g.37125  ORF Transcript_17206/g.37125 Transcript_17206/m.37125 type:complete len:403 (-) Transcript_17206:1494-2702(-)